MKKLMCIVGITFALLAISLQLGAQEKRVKHHHYKLIDLGTLGGPASHFDFGHPVTFSSGGVVNQQGTAVGFAETSTPDPFPAFCFLAPDCQVNHAFQWRNGALTDLGALTADTSSAPQWISPNGLVAGASETGQTDPLFPGLPQIHAVLWRDGKIIDLGTLPGGGYESEAESVNSRGQVVGGALNTVPDPNSAAVENWFLFNVPYGYQQRAFLWDAKNGMQDLGTLPGATDAQAIFINEQGQIAGFSYTNSTVNAVTGIPTQDPFLWENGKMTDLGTLGGAFGYPMWLNNRGQVVGVSDLAGDVNSHGFLWWEGTLEDLGTLGGDTSLPDFISDNGDIVGAADVPCRPTQSCPPEDHRAILWRNGEKIDLGVLPGDSCSRAFMINSSGQIVGNSESEALCYVSGEHAFLWEDGGPIVDLNSLIPPNSSLELSHAFVITDDGEIAGLGVPAGCDPSNDFLCGHAYVLIPCDENHPFIEGCAYGLVDPTAAVEVHPDQITEGPAARASQAMRSPSEMTARFRSSMLGRNRRIAMPQTSPQ
jgi:probable HAF family extracellular repeat protein